MRTCLAPLAVAALLLASEVNAITGRCTYHDYEALQKEYTPSVFDNSPGWCGYRYSSMRLTHVMAMNGVTGLKCNTCYAVRDAVRADTPTQYILAIDQKGDPGLDIALTAFKQIFPNENPLDPQTCSWEEVDASNCFDICRGAAEECTQGVRNSLPAFLLGPAAGTGNLRYSSGLLATGTGVSPNTTAALQVPAVKVADPITTAVSATTATATSTAAQPAADTSAALAPSVVASTKQDVNAPGILVATDASNASSSSEGVVVANSGTSNTQATQAAQTGDIQSKSGAASRPPAGMAAAAFAVMVALAIL
ncbi:hypothetical protein CAUPRSCDRAFT_10612 [Caulochytrium protostelioides]|nr:hypothetical protein CAUPRSCDRAFT_10612 [Caulochytrium protostelioides]